MRMPWQRSGQQPEGYRPRHAAWLPREDTSPSAQDPDATTVIDLSALREARPCGA